MTITYVTKYRTDNGALFDTREEAEAHEWADKVSTAYFQCHPHASSISVFEVAKWLYDGQVVKIYCELLDIPQPPVKVPPWKPDPSLGKEQDPTVVLVSPPDDYL